MKTCTITVRVFVGQEACVYEYNGKPTDTRTWNGVDIMKTAHTRAWATRQFNKFWAEREKDQPIRVEWDCRHDEEGGCHFKGSLSGVNTLRHRRGIFE